MRKIVLLQTALLAITLNAFAKKSTTITGLVKDEKGAGLFTANVSVLRSTDSNLIAVDYADTNGRFEIGVQDAGTYLLRYNILGYGTVFSTPVVLEKNGSVRVPDVVMQPEASNLKEVTFTSKKPLIEVKQGKVIFNVESSINATGSDGLELLRKSPGVMVDNNDNISMKGKSGVKIYIDGKMSQLEGKDLSAYLKSINSNDIETIEMISNPSAKYDASGNAGIINIRLKKNKKLGTNGSANLNYVQGITPKENGSINLNYRNSKVNLFGNLSGDIGKHQNGLNLDRTQLDTNYKLKSTNIDDSRNMNLKAGMDYFMDAKNTLGILLTSNIGNDVWSSTSNTDIYYNNVFMKKLVAYNTIPGNKTNSNANLNYKFADTMGRQLNIDADYGIFRGRNGSLQPNYYYDSYNNPLYSITNRNHTPTDIDIYTLKADWEQRLGKGTLGFGGKVAYVTTNNTFDFYNVVNDQDIKVLSKSNTFKYTENVNAAYINYSNQLTKAINLQLGLRVENTMSKGELTRADGVRQGDDTVAKNYTDLFPNVALGWVLNKENNLNLTYSRRIDRPSYQDLNPFENKLDELSYQKGNAFLSPQYTDIVELTHTYKDALTTTLNYSYVRDYMTQTSDTVGNATYIQQRNIGTQQIASLTIGVPIPIAKWWMCYINASYSYQVYDGQIGANKLNLSLPSYGAYMQQTFTFKNDYSAEVSGMLGGPSIWGGSWHTKPLGGIDLGVQKQFWNKTASLKLSLTDILFTYPWYATSDFGGIKLSANGDWESRTLRLSFTYRFGSNQITSARDRKTGLDAESGRIKSK